VLSLRPILLAVLLASAASAQGQSAPPPVHQYAQLALSPNGATIATVEQSDDPAAPIKGAILLRAAADGHVIRRIAPCATCSITALTFAPNGSLAYLSRDRTAGTVTLLLDAPTPHAVAIVRGIAQTPRFSPDGKRIALLVTIGAAKESGAAQAGARQVGEIGETNDEQRLAVFDIASPTVTAAALKPVSPAGRYVYEYDWTPDGHGFVATSALGNGDSNWWVATLDAIDAKTGAVRQIAKPATQANFPRISPDGKTVAYIGGLMSDFGSVGGDIWTVPLAGGAPTNRTPGYKATFTSLDWRPGGLKATTLSGPDAQIVAVDVLKGNAANATAVQFSRPANFAAGDGKVAYSADGRMMASVVQDFEHAPAIYAGPVGSPRQVTHDNDAVPSLFKAHSITWTNGGFRSQGWLLAPLSAKPAAKAPMIVTVHGGPSAASTPTFISGGLSADLAKAGYYIFMPNPRGSYGQGEAFTAANKRDFGGGDLQDILAGIDAVERAAPVDDARLGLIGGSYGGFMAMWSNTQTNRFKAIVSGAGLSNWISYYGTNGIDQWMIPFFGASVYQDPAIYAKVSPITYITKAKTPTFLYVGERDIEVPPTQSVEYWHALKALGVPTSLVIYPEEGHGIRDPKNAADLRVRTVAWFDRYLK
jgi:dipeptidyl aminopeptidase/acylaminoacyl peptidase